ncbi:nucleotidyltransferase family protein [Nocardioides sp. GY 10113]|uniref:nucleotidyltransferase family protein n=1 Tax=Nocardioides sp. GY 10113 TaxID=2569761 RepID=UPI0010A8B720|nr:nucleotidyltransferase family protein [Nocardioides sp. GY 10113]TIC85859.1 nucleotidyltransferase family protein [Nocardioides sp. GY 10113]
MATGLLLAAGAGRRMGTPKALIRDGDGRPWLWRAIAALRRGGCDGVTVVLGAAAEEAEAVLAPEHGGPPEVEVVHAADWAAGLGASLSAGLRALLARPTGPGSPSAAMVLLVDLPDVGPDVVRRVLSATGGGSASTLARASYHGKPGHPVLIGRDHWPHVLETAVGDHGARDYLAAHEVVLVECGDLASGEDVDRPRDPRAEPTGDQRRAP